MADLATILDVLRRGGVAIVPTESSFALAARVATEDASKDACANIAELKGRPDGKAFPVVAIPEHLAALVDVDWAIRLTRLVDAGFWPGPLSVAVPARAGLPPHVLDAGRIAIRIPRHDRLTTLCRAVGAPLTATSANHSGAPPIISSADARTAFPGVPILDAGTLPGGAPSTIVAVSDSFDVVLVREGAVPWARARTIAEVLRG